MAALDPDVRNAQKELERVITLRNADYALECMWKELGKYYSAGSDVLRSIDALRTKLTNAAKPQGVIQCEH